MTEFTSPFWDSFITITTVVSIAFCFWLAVVMSSTKTNKTASGETQSTGHVWDEDLVELNNPLPRWWFYLFLMTCVYGGIYLWLYPGLGTFKGQFNWTQEGQYDKEIAAANAKYDPLFDKFLSQDIEKIAGDQQAVEMGERLYLTYCVQCHGSDARGSKGFPNLADGSWLGNGDGAYIKHTILNGRVGVMPPMGVAVGAGNVENLAHYVLSLSGSIADPVKTALGKESFVTCAACHGPDGKGNPALGAPNLTDKTWLYGGGLKTVIQTINQGRTNQMPSFGGLISDGKAHVLAAYVLSLSKKPPSADAANTAGSQK